jgi:crotonobetaine/carnitine-CoA ligase
VAPSADVDTRTLPELLRERVLTQADALFLQDVGGDAATYGDALARSGAWSGVFAQLTVGAGDRVATLVGNCVESVLCWLGIASLRAIEAPIHPAFSGYMLEHAVNTIEAEVVVTEASRLPALAASIERLPAVRTVIVLGDAVNDPGWPSVRVLASGPLLAAATAPAGLELPRVWDTGAIIYTSGTTGPSKGVLVPWGELSTFAHRTYPFDDLGADDVFYVFTPSSHIGAKVLPLLAGLLGGRAVMRADFKIDEFLADIRQFGITTSPAVGAIPHFLAQMPASPDDADIPLRNMVMAPLVADLDGFRNRFGVRICTAYAMTEVSIPFTSEGWNVDNHRAVGKLCEGWPGIEVRIVDEHDIEVPVGETGELIVRSSEPWTMNSGYYGMPEATARAWRNGWFHTGDGFRRDEEGFFYFVDRIKDAIRRRGENISSFEVEAITNMHPAVAESAAVGSSADALEEEVKVFVVVKSDEKLDPRELLEFLIPRMPRFMVPRFVELIDELPKTPGTMRVKKAELRALGQTERTWDRVSAGLELPGSSKRR